MNLYNRLSLLIRANIKRLKSYIPKLLTTTILLVIICSVAFSIITRKLYTENTYEVVNIAYYLPEDDDERYNLVALRMMENMESISEVANLTRVSQVEEGYDMLEAGEILFYVIVPEQFFTGIMDGTNPKLTIIIHNYDSMDTYIANELLLSYARYLGIAQSGIYSGLDTAWEHDFPDEEVAKILDNTNIIYLERALNHENYLKTVDAKDAGNYTLTQHYIASIIVLVLFFSGFILSSFIQRKNKGLITLLDCNGVNGFYRYISDTIAVTLALYFVFIPCFIAVCIYIKSFPAMALLEIIVVTLIVSLIICLCNLGHNNVLTANLTLFVVSLSLIYIGGGILPVSFLPGIVRHISVFLPGEYLIKIVEHALFI